jgi:hypothetical protein
MEIRRIDSLYHGSITGLYSLTTKNNKENPRD